MKCPYMTGNYMFSCSARREAYIPSTFEFSEYCSSERYEPYKTCPHYPHLHEDPHPVISSHDARTHSGNGRRILKS